MKEETKKEKKELQVRTGVKCGSKDSSESYEEQFALGQSISDEFVKYVQDLAK